MTWEWFLSTIPVLLKTCRIMLFNLLPFLIIGIILGEVLKLTSWTKIIYKWVSRSPVISVVSASIIGMISPLCTYGTIPVVIELYKSKVHIAPLIAFLSASSLINPQIFILTVGGIGLEMALARTVAVFIFSFATGMLSYLIPVKFIVRKSIGFYEDGGDQIINREKKLFIVKQFIINCLKSLRHIGVYLLIGILIGAAVELYFSKGLLYEALRAGRVQSIIAGALLGIPMYMCGGGAIPFVNAMLANGMGKGTALAFFIVGPATRPTPIIAMAVLFTPLFLFGYFVFLVFSAVLMGLFYI